MEQHPSRKANSSSGSQRNFWHIVEPEVLLPRSKHPSTYPLFRDKRIESTPSQPASPIIHFNIILPSTPRPSKWSPSFRSLHQYTDTTFLYPTRATCSAPPPFLDLITRKTVSAPIFFKFFNQQTGFRETGR
jgi:hypothetical protein